MGELQLQPLSSGHTLPSAEAHQATHKVNVVVYHRATFLTAAFDGTGLLRLCPFFIYLKDSYVP